MLCLNVWLLCLLACSLCYMLKIHYIPFLCHMCQMIMPEAFPRRAPSQSKSKFVAKIQKVNAVTQSMHPPSRCIKK
ncbi:hypothetical protein GGI42DRAFT_271931 [Trichoderma sp. SZMC 28013]